MNGEVVGDIVHPTPQDALGSPNRSQLEAIIFDEDVSLIKFNLFVSWLVVENKSS